MPLTGVRKLFCKEPHSKEFRLCEPYYNICCKYPNMPVKRKELKGTRAGMAVFQQHFVYKNKWWATLGHRLKFVQSPRKRLGLVNSHRCRTHAKAPARSSQFL